MNKLYFRKVYEVTGYAYEAETYCVDCFRDEANLKELEAAHPIFLGDEWDYAPSCGICGEEIDVQEIEYD